MTQISPFLVIVQSQLLVRFFHFSENVFQESIDSFLPYDSSSFIKLDYYFGPFVECLKVHKHEIFFVTFFAETETIWSQGPVTRDFKKSYSNWQRYSTFKHFRACSACDEIGS